MSRAAMLSLALVALCVTAARAEDPRQGIDYKVFDTATCMAPSAPTIEVVEIFAYSCIHCYRLEQSIKGWVESLPKGMSYYKLPVTWGQEEPLARLYWSMQATGVSNYENDMAVFREIHARRTPFRSEREVAVIAQRIGLDSKNLRRTGQSFLVSSRIKRATSLVRTWQVTGTPAFVVAGRYKISSTRENLLSQARMLEVVRWLAEREVAAGRSGCQNDN